VVADEVQAWARDERRETLHPFQRRHHHVRGAVTLGGFQFVHDLAAVGCAAKIKSPFCTLVICKTQDGCSAAKPVDVIHRLSSAP
jgi:hypothetical protein